MKRLLLWILEPMYLQGVADGRRLEREAIIKAASGLRAVIPADHPKGAMASFADYLQVTGGDR